MNVTKCKTKQTEITLGLTDETNIEVLSDLLLDKNSTSKI
jgi:hypothetical protein